MFEPAISNRSKQLWLEQKVTKASRVDADVVAALFLGTGSAGCQVAASSLLRVAVRPSGSGCASSASISRLELFVRIIDQVLLV